MHKRAWYQCPMGEWAARRSHASTLLNECAARDYKCLTWCLVWWWRWQEGCGGAASWAAVGVWQSQTRACDKKSAAARWSSCPTTSWTQRVQCCNQVPAALESLGTQRKAVWKEEKTSWTGLFQAVDLNDLMKIFTGNVCETHSVKTGKQNKHGQQEPDGKVYINIKKAARRYGDPSSASCEMAGRVALYKFEI